MTGGLAELVPVVLAALVRRHRSFDRCEDAVQEALLAAARQWPRDGRPADPTGWLIRVASRRLIDQLRSDTARAAREQRDAVLGSAATDDARFAGDEGTASAVDDRAGFTDRDGDDTLTLFVLCCHPVLTAASQVALTLRAVGGLTTAEIAAAFVVPEATMGQRISRAKAAIERAGATFTLPAGDELAERLRAVLHVLYLVFNEGYAASTGDRLVRRELTAEALRLTRELRRLRPADPEVAGLLALMLLTDARRGARLRDGDLVPLDEQDRTAWDRAAIAEGVALVESTLATTAALGPYQLEAAIAAVHDEAPSADETDWVEILALYDLLERVAPNPMVTLNRAVAVGEVHGPSAGLAVLDTVEDRLADHHRYDAVRAFLLERAGEIDGARAAYRRAARRTRSLPERRHLERRLRGLADLVDEG